MTDASCTQLAAVVTQLRTAGRGAELVPLVGRWARAATRAGVPVWRQLELLAYVGIRVGVGAPGADRVARSCPYCRAQRGGTHGDLCPRLWTPDRVAPASPRTVLQDQE